MNLLKEGLEQHVVERTTMTRKLTVDGLTKAYPVYKIRLDWLFYNDQNDRIATWISQYKAQHGGQAPDISKREEYNNIIEQFIVESNPDAIRKTQSNIEMVDQREAGVVLADGRIIDGNRRFTCLRRLSAKNPRFNYFEAVILDRNIENSAKQIKLLELSIQHGEESKVDYNPIDRLVGIYTDIVETHLLTSTEYAASTNESETDVNRRVEIAKLMVEFLEFINADYSDEVRSLIDNCEESSKFCRCIELTEKLVRQNKPVIVWCMFVGSIRRMADALEARGIRCRCVFGEVPLEERQQILNDFRAGGIQVLLTNPHTLAESVSLHSVCHDAIYFEYSYNLVHLLQSKDRIHRLGLPEGQYTQYYYLQLTYQTEDGAWSLDGAVYDRLREKERIMLEAIDCHRLERMPTSEEDLDTIFDGLF